MVLETVPGLIVTQHTGDGKANQYFLRGFNLDHGTDFATFALGMPVNLPTHAHGQGYTDVNFLIPELISGVRYRKGPYSVQQGDFAAAGSASIEYVRTLPGAFAEVGLGGNGFRRLLAADSAERSGAKPAWRGERALGLGLAFATPLAALVLYLALGRPDLPGQPCKGGCPGSIGTGVRHPPSR
mgnify:CR=1 FL=1